MEKQKYEDYKQDPPAGCFLRLFWMMVGNALLLFGVYGIVQHRSSILSVADIFYWAIVASLLAARYVDIRHCFGTTTDGHPATMDHWRRYATFLGAATTVLWLGAHIVAYYGT